MADWRDPIQESLKARASALHGAARTPATTPGAPAPSTQVVYSPTLLTELRRAYNLQYISMIAQSDVVTDVGAPFACDAIGTTDRYLPLIVNETDNPIRMQVVAEFTTPGATVKLAYASDSSDRAKIDVLGLTANGRVLSVPIILGGGETLFVNTADSSFPLAADDVLRVRIFDAARLLSVLASNPPPNLR